MKKYSLYFIIMILVAWSSLAFYFYLQRNQFPLQIEISSNTDDKHAIDNLKIEFEVIAHENVWYVILHGNEVSFSYQGKASKQDYSYDRVFIDFLSLTQEVDERLLEENMENMQCEYSVFGKNCSLEIQGHQYQYVIKDIDQNIIASTTISLKNPDKTLRMRVHNIKTKDLSDMIMLNQEYITSELPNINVSSTYDARNSKFKSISGNLTAFQSDEFTLKEDIFGVYKYENDTYHKVIAQDSFHEMLHIIKETPDQLWIFRNIMNGDPAIEIYDHNGVLLDKTIIDMDTLESLYAYDDIVMLNVKDEEHNSNVHIWQKQERGFSEIDVFHNYSNSLLGNMIFYQDHRIYKINNNNDLQIEVYDRDKGYVYFGRLNTDIFNDKVYASSQSDLQMGWQFLMQEHPSNVFIHNLKILEK